MRYSRRIMIFSASVAPFALQAIGAAQALSAAAELKPAAERLGELLQFVPAGSVGGKSVITWNDYAKQVSAIQEFVGATDLPAEELAKMSTYTFVPDFMTYAKLLPDFAGYSLADISQVVSFGVTPENGLVMELHVDADAQNAFWESMEYEKRENDYGNFWTFGEEGEISLTNDIQQMMKSRFNNVAFLTDNVIAYASTSALLAKIQAAAAGDAPNVVADVEAIVAQIPADTSSVFLVDSSGFDASVVVAGALADPETISQMEDQLAESDSVAGTMPAIRLACIGLTAGGTFDEAFHNPESREFILLELVEPDGAEGAVGVITWRAENMQSLMSEQPYIDELPGLEVEAISGSIVQSSLPLVEPPSTFVKMFMTRDLLLFTY